MEYINISDMIMSSKKTLLDIFTNDVELYIVLYHSYKIKLEIKN